MYTALNLNSIHVHNSRHSGIYINSNSDMHVQVKLHNYTYTIHVYFNVTYILWTRTCTIVD